MKKFLLVLTALVLSLAFVACGETTTEATTAAPTTEEPAMQVLNWNIGADPQTIDPTLNGASDGGDVINQTFEGLVREVGGVVVAGIAESWTTSADGLTVTFTLRDSKWSDGSDLTASDFVYSWLRGMDQATASEYAWIWEYTNIVGSIDAVYWSDECNNTTEVCNVYDEDDELVGDDQADGLGDDNGLNYADTLAAVGISAPDDNTLVVELVNPTPYFVSLMAFYHFMPVKQSAVEAVGGEEGLWAKDPDLVVCNGPFKLVEYVSGDGLKLVKNDEYWNADEVYIDEIYGEFIELATTAYVAYNAGELDVLPSVPNAMVSALIAEDPNFYVFPLLGTYYYNFNLDPSSPDYDPIFDNVNLRKALAYSIDREAITEALSAGQVPATGFVPTGFLDDEGNDFAVESGNYGIATDTSNYADAVTLFATAASDMSMTVAELQTALEGKVILYNTSEGHKLVAEMVQESWRVNLGINVTLANEEWAVFQETRENGEFDIARGGWLTDFMDPAGLLAIFTSENAYNDPGYDNAAFDTLMTDAQATTDIATHFDKLYAAQDLLMADMPIIPVYYYADTYLIRETVQDWGRSVLGSLDFTHATIVTE
ncbi:peptide ABC transporter substrate-binding protein [Candidatus Izemoplasma sp. B36]|uniref:peptide ABC transporter substrate-binding protein n=1 Tax=Candidatus Izemoplasma sp. B36 TaxID=3242468 RepID=UPI0035560395